MYKYYTFSIQVLFFLQNLLNIFHIFVLNFIKLFFNFS